MSTDRQVIDACSRLEALLKTQYGAAGAGLNEKLDSVLAMVPAHVIKRIRYISSVRNKLVHDAGYEVDDLDGYLNTVDFVEKELQKVALTSKPDAQTPSHEQLSPSQPPSDKEQPIIVLRPTPMSQLTPIAVSLLMLQISVLFAMKDLVGMAYFFFATALLIMVKPIYRTYSEQYLIFEDKVVRKSGIIITSETLLPRKRIITRNVRFKSLSGRIFDFGDVEFASAASDAAEVIFSNVRYPKKIAEYVYRIGAGDVS